MPVVTASRFHDLSCGHRVAGHESRCAHLHGHNYRIHFTVSAPLLDSVGRVIDFTMMNSRLCMWLEHHWDHKFLAWDGDTLIKAIMQTAHMKPEDAFLTKESIVWVPFNPTAENIALHLLNEIGPQQLEGTGVKLIKVVVEETRKCSASAEL